MTPVVLDIPVLVTAPSARELGWLDGENARHTHVGSGVITRPAPTAHGITTRRARAEYHQGWILGRMGASLRDTCPACHTRHAANQHLSGVVTA